MKTKILVAEDDTNIREGLQDTLELEGFEVVTAADGRQALTLAGEQEFDLLVLDIMMPGMSGYDVCREIRRSDDIIPIIMLTAKSEEIDKVVGLELGADDYITKPFGIRELIARIGAVLRRSRQSAAAETDLPGSFAFGVATIDRRGFRGTIKDRDFELSPREMELIRIFHTHPGEVLSRDELLKMAWEVEYGSYTRTLDQHISQLRKKIEPDPKNPRIITTVHGVGYRYEGSVASDDQSSRR